jgi:hypothetical protein
MADEDYDDQNDGTDGSGVQRTNSEWAELRREKKAARDALAQVNEMKRENAFLKAGINPEGNKVAALFVKAYDGDLSTEKILEAAAEIGITAGGAAPGAAPQQDQNAAALAAAARVAQAAGPGAIAAPTGEAAQRQALEDAYKAGGMEALTAAMQAAGIPRAVT